MSKTLQANDFTEKELVENAKADPQAFAILFDKYYEMVLSYAFRRTMDMELAKDITSETFLKAFNSINKFNWREISFGAWLYRIATNEVNMYFRKRKYKAVSLSYLKEQFGFDVIDISSEEQEQNSQKMKETIYEEFIFLQSRIKDLPVKYQEVLTLRYFEHKSIKEISAILVKKEGTIKSLLSRAIARLKEFLQ